MKTKWKNVCAMSLIVCSGLPVLGDLAIARFSVAGGSGVSTGGVFTVQGTVGQAEAARLTGGSYTVDGGFWGAVVAVQTPGAPMLEITRSNATVVVSWKLPANGWKLEYATSLTGGSGSWSQIAPPYSSNATHCFVLDASPSGNRFYRLCR